MDELRKQRIAYALGCEPSEVTDDPEELKSALAKRREELKKAKEVKHG